MKRRGLDEDARQLFRTAVADAVPLASDRVHHEPPPPPAIPRSRELDEAQALAESLTPELLDLQLEGGDQAAWARPGIARSVLRDLRRGRWVVEAYLDLHGRNREQARQDVASFIAACVAGGRRCVRIVHGKGLRSPGREPVLKGLVAGWLAQKREVLAFCQARTIEGGAGALVILLQPPRR